MAGVVKRDMSELVSSEATLARAGARRTATPWLLAGLAAAMLALALVLAGSYAAAPLDHPGLVESTPGQLAVWAAQRSDLEPEAFLPRARLALAGLALAAAAFSGLSLFHIWTRPSRSRPALFWNLVAFAGLLLNVPLDAGTWYWLVLAGLALALAALFLARGPVSNLMGMVVVISGLLLVWEVYVALGVATGGALPLTDFPWKMPHWQAIAEQLLQPARRNGPVLLVQILGDAALVTWREAFTGFLAGSLLGLLLGILFAHSRLLERALLPYAVASQTVPILALAPMIVTALGAGWVPVAVISAYLTFFPVAVNTLRGLLSPEPMSLELMRSYAASPWAVLWKLRLPAALPYIFTALKVSATGSVVGAIVGELPSSRSDGLAAAILRASGNYAAEPEKLWATILMASLVGILFFAAVTLVEQWVMRRRPKSE
jgi:NitT/TauT family transport system permease protein